MISRYIIYRKYIYIIYILYTISFRYYARNIYMTTAYDEYIDMLVLNENSNSYS